MAKVRVSVAMLEEFLFEGSKGLVIITNVSFDQQEQYIVFNIEGPAVPDVKEVRCEITQQYRTCKFIPITTSQPEG